MFNRLALISIPVADQQAAKAFYTERLGCTVMEDRPFAEGGETRWIRLALPGVETAVTLVTWFPQMPPGCVQGLVLTTDDRATVHAALRERGVAISAIAQQPYGQEATFSDPDGNGWVVLEPARPA